MRGTPTPEQAFEVIDTGLNPELRRFLKETLQSPKSEEVQRYLPFVEPGHIFPYEGTLASHSTGTYRRGNRLMVLEDRERDHEGLPPLALNRSFQRILHKTHDLGELGHQGDIVHGKKDDDHRVIERRQFEENIARIQDPDLQRTLDAVGDVSKHHQETVAGQFWKNLVEHGGFLETARRIHREFVNGEVLDHDHENQISGMYLHRSVRRDDAGQEIPPELRGVRAITADILINTAGLMLKAARDFAAARAYLRQYAREYRGLYDEYVLDVSQRAQHIAEVTALKEYTAAAAAAVLEGKVSQDVVHFVAYLDTLIAESPLERRAPSDWTELHPNELADVA